MKQKSKEMEINSKDLLVNIKGLFLHDDGIEEEKKKENIDIKIST